MPGHSNVVQGVSLQDVTFHSAALDRQMQYRVFVPANAAATRALPVAYLPHGAGDDFHTWSNNTDISKYAANGLILIMPQGDLS